jgi:inner membrane protein
VIGSHIAADALTPMGVEPYRDGRHYSYDVAKAANPLANYALLAVGVLAVGVAYVAGATVGAVVGA